MKKQITQYQMYYQAAFRRAEISEQVINMIHSGDLDRAGLLRLIEKHPADFERFRPLLNNMK